MGYLEMSKNVGIAFGVVIGSGLATAIGAAVVFFPSMIRYADRKTLAAGLGLSAGVMTYVSFVEIFMKSVQSFKDADFLEKQAYLSATMCFFAGIIIMQCLNLLIHGMVQHNHLTSAGVKHSHIDGDVNEEEGEEEEEDDDDDSLDDEELGTTDKNKSDTKGARERHKSHKSDKSHNGSSCQMDVSKMSQQELVDASMPCLCSSNPAAKLDNLKEMAQEMEEIAVLEDEDDDKIDKTIELSDSNLDEAQSDHSISKQKKNEDKQKRRKKKKNLKKKEKQRLTTMSLNTAVAIALHNFPEGLATFVATMNDPAVGAVLAIAVAIHNIPEGLCVAMPVYYATGNRWKAFSWGLLSGISEPIAALLGWLVLARWFSNMAYAVLFGIVAGMMVMISVKELLPTAHRYDPTDSVVTNMFIIGMGIMAASLVLFAFM